MGLTAMGATKAGRTKENAACGEKPKSRPFLT